MKTKFLILMTVVFLQGCTAKQEIQIKTVEVERQPLILEDPTPLVLHDVNFKVLNSDEFGKPYFALDTKNYKNLSKDMLYLQKYIISLKQMIKAYRDYYIKDANIIADSPKK